MEIRCPRCGACGTPGSEFDFSPSKDACWCDACDFLISLKPETDDRRVLLLLEDKHQTISSGADGRIQLRDPISFSLKKYISPLRYPGGKSRVIDQIFRHIKTGKTEIFVELFAGGASLGLSLLEAGVIQHLVLNDFDPAVANFWDIVVHHGEALCKIISSAEPTRSQYFAGKKLISQIQAAPSSLSQLETTEKIQLAYDFLVVNRLSYGGIQMANPLAASNRSSQELLSRWNPRTLVRRISRISAVSEQISICNKDAVSYFSDEIGWLPSSSTIFIDPPYFHAGPRLYPFGFEFGHTDLADAISSFFHSYPGPDIILTYDNCSSICDLYPFAQKQKLLHSWSISRAV